jgi:hypothetical protein
MFSPHSDSLHDTNFLQSLHPIADVSLPSYLPFPLYHDCSTGTAHRVLIETVVFRRNADTLQMLDRLQLHFRRVFVIVHQLSEWAWEVPPDLSASILGAQATLLTLVVFGGRCVRGRGCSMKKRTHERDAGESDCDGRFKAREDCREHTAVCHVRKVQAREQRLSVDSNDPCSSSPIQ